MTYSIVFEVKQLEIVLNSLANSPYNVVSPTIESVKAQIYQQNQLAEEEAEAVPEKPDKKKVPEGVRLG